MTTANRNRQIVAKRLRQAVRSPRIAIVAVWTTFSAWFLATEILPHSWLGSPDGYDAIIADGLMHRDTWMRILDGERTIGYSHSRIDIDEFAPEGQYLLFNKTVADLSFLGTASRTIVDSRIVLNSNRQLEQFEIKIQAADQTIRLQGKHAGKGTFEIQMHGPMEWPPVSIKLPPDAMVMDPTAGMALRRLRPGRKITLQVFDPLTLRTSPLTVRSLRRETITHRGRPRSVTVLAAEHQGITLHSWIDNDGNLLRQETPLGWVLEACEPADALEFIRPRPSQNATPSGTGKNPITPSS